LTLPGTAFPQENWLDKIWADKWIHIGMFSTMSFLTCWAFYKRKMSADSLRRFFILAGLLAFAYGIIMEFIQLYFVAHRSFDTGDIIADGVGSFIGVWFSTWRYIKK
jgi:VanZ family protein